MSQQVLTVSGSTQQLLTYIELIFCQILKLRSVLPESSFQSENYLEMGVSRLSESFDKDLIEGVVHALRGWLPTKQVHRVDLDIYQALTEKLVEKWIFYLEYFPVDKQVPVQNSQTAITAVFKDIEMKTQLCMLPLGEELTYDILFKVNEGPLPLGEFLEPAIPHSTDDSNLTEVQFGSIPTGSHCLTQSCFTSLEEK